MLYYVSGEVTVLEPGLAVIDCAGESGFGYARVKNKEYQLDNIHLNKLGGLNMGNFVWSKLKDIPLWKVQCSE